MKTCKFSALICLLVFWSTLVYGQTFFEDSEGESSIFLPIGGNVRINTADKSLKFSHYYNISDKDFVFGIDASGKSLNGFAPILTNGKLVPEANVHFHLGFKNVSTDDADLQTYDYLNIRIGTGASKYKILNPDAYFDQQISSETFNMITVGVSYNYFLNGNTIFGLYGGYERKNNIGSLTELTIKERIALGAVSEGTTSRFSEQVYTAWQGDFEIIDQFSLYLDYVYIPDFLKNRVAISLYSRSGFSSTFNETNGGVGIYLNKEGEPLKIVGGVIYEFEDLFGSREDESSINQRGTMGIVLGYHF